MVNLILSHKYRVYECLISIPSEWTQARLSFLYLTSFSSWITFISVLFILIRIRGWMFPRMSRASSSTLLSLNRWMRYKYKRCVSRVGIGQDAAVWTDGFAVWREQEVANSESVATVKKRREHYGIGGWCEGMIFRDFGQEEVAERPVGCTLWAEMNCLIGV